MKTRVSLFGIGALAGLLNGLFGSGGGLLLVPLLESQSIPPRQAHASSIAIIFPLSLISTVLLLLRGTTADFSPLWILLPTGCLGALLGTRLLPKMKGALLKRLFGGVMLFSAVRILLR